MVEIYTKLIILGEKEKYIEVLQVQLKSYSSFFLRHYEETMITMFNFIQLFLKNTKNIHVFRVRNEEC